ncbi:MAG TPA: hypothetical protein VN959_17545, partial [Mycobacterium sp.]|nr:hypothetical protein [Mycobacterium sp.]
MPRLPQRVIEVLSRKEIDHLEPVAPTERDKLIIRLLAYTGIRVGELCGLVLGDFVTGSDRRALLKVR